MYIRLVTAAIVTAWRKSEWMIGTDAQDVMTFGVGKMEQRKHSKHGCNGDLYLRSCSIATRPSLAMPDEPDPPPATVV